MDSERIPQDSPHSIAGGNIKMRILHILADGPSALSNSIIEAQSGDNELKIIDLSKKVDSYDSVIDEIASCDKVVSW
ncbi:MAG: hypothetical protein M0Z61_04470 [Nitrospiraceae bacterium]|nr:hypothetical protein [Nitrospiraceae bacterium]